MKEEITIPAVKSWRDIPQNVKPRAMSREGRRRLQLRLFRIAGGFAILGVGIWGAWEVAAALRSEPDGIAMGGRAAAVAEVSVHTDGVLDRAWVERTLALPRHATLMGLELGLLRARLLASGQVRAASLERKFPSSLAVTLSERSPVARILPPGAPEGAAPLLVARDGIAYVGVGYDASLTGSLPWLTGVTLERTAGGGYAPVAGMDAVAELLSRAQLDTAAIYRTWREVSLSRLQSDGEIQVVAGDGLKVTFGAQDDFYRQLAKLDLLLDAAVAKPDQVVREINLSLGGQVSLALGSGAGGIRGGGSRFRFRSGFACAFAFARHSPTETSHQLT